MSHELSMILLPQDTRLLPIVFMSFPQPMEGLP